MTEDLPTECCDVATNFSSGKVRGDTQRLYGLTIKALHRLKQKIRIMTALVGILNKRAVAIAADSAITVSYASDERKKIYNTGQKIFRLSEAQPVGIMLYNNVEFMSTPWEVIIKLYHDRCGHHNLPLLKDYKEDFVKFLYDNQFFTTEAEQRMLHLDTLRDCVRKVHESASEEYSQANEANLDDLPVCEQLPYYEKWTDELIAGCRSDGVSAEFEDYTFDMFMDYSREYFQTIHEDIKENDIPSKKGMWEKACYEFIRSKRVWNFTGLVFVGYGADQIFPAIYEIGIDIAYDGRLRLIENEDSYSAITAVDKQSEIMSFAQDDVIKTLLKGLAPNIKEQYDSVIGNGLDAMKGNAMDIMKSAKVPPAIREKIGKMDNTEILDKINEDMDDYIAFEYIFGLYDSVAYFNVQDMATMAESLISITKLQRHITSSEETVGGPIDVAVITRSEGFTWVRHKIWAGDSAGQ